MTRKRALDIKQLVSDGKTMVWLEGSNSSALDGGAGTVFAHYALYESAYTTDPAKLQPHLLADDVPVGLSSLVMANGYVAGTYLISQPVYRSAAFLVRRSDGKQMRSTLPNGYSWGYEVYPSATELWGSITTGPMIDFETIARVPYEAL